jgi:cell wall-associated NlpC family hydrolase
MALSAAYAVVAIASVASSVDQRKQAKKAQKKADELRQVDQAQAADAAARSRRQQVREARIAAAKQANIAAAQDQTGSSAVLAAQAGVQAQANEGIGQIGTTLGYGSLQSKLQGDIFNLQQPTDTQYAADVIGSIAGGYTGAKK